MCPLGIIIIISIIVIIVIIAIIVIIIIIIIIVIVLSQVGIVSFGSSAGCEVGAPAGFTR